MNGATMALSEIVIGDEVEPLYIVMYNVTMWVDSISLLSPSDVTLCCLIKRDRFLFTVCTSFSDTKLSAPVSSSVVFAAAYVMPSKLTPAEMMGLVEFTADSCFSQASFSLDDLAAKETFPWRLPSSLYCRPVLLELSLSCDLLRDHSGESRCRLSLC